MLGCEKMDLVLKLMTTFQVFKMISRLSRLWRQALSAGRCCCAVYLGQVCGQVQTSCLLSQRRQVLAVSECTRMHWLLDWTRLVPTKILDIYTSTECIDLQIFAYQNPTFLELYWRSTSGTMATTFRHAKFRQQSFKTSRDSHIPKLSKMIRAPTVMFLGSSMFERMGTTGQWQSQSLWPSEAMITTGRLGQLNDSRVAESLEPLNRISGAFNAGCCGDSIENTLHRLIGYDNAKTKENPFYRLIQSSKRRDARGKGTVLGLRDVLSMRKSEVHLWVIDVGTSSFGETENLNEESMSALREILLTIFGMSSPSTLVLLTGIPYRLDTNREVIDKANEQLLALTLEVAHDIQILDQDRQRVGLKQYTKMGHIWWEIGEKPTDEDIARHDSVVSGLRTLSTNDHNQAAKTNPDDSFVSLVAKVQEATQIAELERNIARFDFATKSAPMKPRPRIEFLPMPGNISIKKHPENDENLSLEEYKDWAEALFPKVREMLDRAELLHHVVRSGERQYYQRLPEYAPWTNCGSFYKTRIRRQKVWTCKGRNWLVVNPGTLKKLENQIHKEGMLLDGSDEDDKSKSEPDARTDLPSARKFLLVDEMATRDGVQKAGGGAPKGRDESPSSQGSIIIDADMFLPASDQPDSDSSSSSKPPSTGSVYETSSDNRTPQKQKFRARVAAFFRRLKAGWKRRH